MRIVELKEALDEFLMLDRARSTRETYSKILNRFVVDIGPGRPVDQIRSEDVNAYIFKLRERSHKWETHPTRRRVDEPLSPSTIYKHSKTIKRFFNWCIECDYITQSPARRLSNRPPSHPLGADKAATDREVKAILREVRKKPRDRAVVMILVTSAARACEVASLRIRDLVLEDNRAFVDGKGAKRREIYFLPETTVAIREWLELRPDDAPNNYLFPSTRGHGKMHPQAISQITRRLCAAADLDRSLGAHAFRHYVAMKLARERVPLPVIQAWMGHSDPVITLQYQRSLNRDDLRAAGSALALGL